jgi:hypothetical protein
MNLHLALNSFEIVMLLIGVGVLIKAHGVIHPRRDWWLFAARDGLWTALIVDDLLGQLNLSILGEIGVALVYGLIIVLFLSAMIDRYRLHLKWKRYREKAAGRIGELEAMRGIEGW